MIIDSKVWLERAKKVTIEEIPNFIYELFRSVNWDNEDEGYINIVNVAYLSMMATFYAIDDTEDGGITGFQASGLAWKLFKEFMGYGKDDALKILNYRDMLYPYSRDNFTTIDKETFEWLQKEAKQLLKDKNYSPLDSNIIVHLLKIVDGKVPFGYTLKEESDEKSKQNEDDEELNKINQAISDQEEYDKARWEEERQEERDREMEWRRGAEQEND